MTIPPYQLSELFVQQIQDAAAYYQAELTRQYDKHAGRNMARDFTAEIEATVSKVIQHPKAYAPYDPDMARPGTEVLIPSQLRRISIDRFPYTIFYTVGSDERIYFEACYHQHSNYARHLMQELSKDQQKRLGLTIVKE